MSGNGAQALARTFAAVLHATADMLTELGRAPQGGPDVHISVR